MPTLLLLVELSDCPTLSNFNAMISTQLELELELEMLNLTAIVEGQWS